MSKMPGIPSRAGDGRCMLDPLPPANFRIVWWVVVDDFGNCIVCQAQMNDRGYYKLFTHV